MSLTKVWDGTSWQIMNGSSIEIDSEISSTSTNPVQNKKIHEALQDLESEIPSLSGYATEAWVEGKGYLTEHQSLSAYRTSSAQDTIDAGFNNRLNTIEGKEFGWDSKSTVSVSASGTSTSEVQYITIDGVEKKLAGGSSGVPEAPSDDKKYGRKNEDWEEIDEISQEKKQQWDNKQEPIETLTEEIPYSVNFKDTMMVKDATKDDIAIFDLSGDTIDSGKKLSEYIEYSDHEAMKKLMNDVVLDENQKAALISTGSVPATASDFGFKGQIVFDSDYMYVCIADNTWKKIALQAI